MTGTRTYVFYRGTRSRSYVFHGRASTCSHVRNCGACSFTDLADRVTRTCSHVFYRGTRSRPYVFHG
jgi:hypothetical protein